MHDDEAAMFPFIITDIDGVLLTDSRSKVTTLRVSLEGDTKAQIRFAPPAWEKLKRIALGLPPNRVTH